MTDNNQNIDLFHSLIQHKESEVMEFKKTERNFDFDATRNCFGVPTL